MMVKKYHDLCREMFETGTLESKLGMLQEESAEVIQAVNKWRRDDISELESVTKLTEEIADLKMTLDQIIYGLDIEYEINKIIVEKAKRYYNRKKIESEILDTAIKQFEKEENNHE